MTTRDGGTGRRLRRRLRRPFLERVVVMYVVVADMAFLLQGAAPAELPEELFGCVRIEHIVMKDAHKLDLSGASTPP